MGFLTVGTDIASWPKLTHSRPRGALGHRSGDFQFEHKLRTTLCSIRMIVRGLGGILVFMEYEKRWGIVFLTLVVGCMYVLCAVHIGVKEAALFYLGMESFMDDSDLSRPWWWRLSRTLPRPSAKADELSRWNSWDFPWLIYIELHVLRGVIVLARAMQWCGNYSSTLAMRFRK